MKCLVFMIYMIQISGLNINVSIKIPIGSPAFVKFELNNSNYTIISADEVVYHMVVGNSSNNSTDHTVPPNGNMPIDEIVQWSVVAICGVSLVLLSVFVTLSRRPKEPVIQTVRDPAAIKISRDQFLLSEKDR